MKPTTTSTTKLQTLRDMASAITTATAPLQPSNAQSRQCAFISSIKSYFALVVLMAGVCALPQMAHGIEVQTTTALTISPASVDAGVAATLTAIVMRGTDPITRGVVVFCDANATHCEGSAIFGTAQLTSSGTATLKLILGVDTYSIDAIFLGTHGNPTSTSAAHTLTVNGNASYASSTTISEGGSAGNYTLAATVAAFGRPVPSGRVSFLGRSNPNFVAGAAALDPITLGFSLTPAAGLSAVGYLPYSVAAGDFNNDGKMDLAVPNGNSTVSVLLGNGDGTFQPSAIYNTDPNGTPYTIAIGDFNGDGNIDLVVTNSLGGLVDCADRNPDTVSILLGNGDGTFQPQHTFAVGFGVQGVAVGDFNDDGSSDVAVTNNTNNSVSVLLGNGDGTFQPRLTYAVGNQPSSISTADFNGDGQADLVVSNLGDNTVSILLGNGDGTFQPQVTYATGNYPVGVAVGDFNGDGNPDLVVANSNDSTVSVLLGKGDGTFRSQVTYATGSYPFGATVGDFNGDGKTDLAIPNFVDSTVNIFLGKGDGTFRPQLTYAGGNYPVGIAVGDFNGDGLMDVATADHTESSVVRVLLSEQTETATISGVSVYGQGTHNALASYVGDASHAASQSTTVPLMGVAQITTTRLTASLNPGIAGQLVTFTATVSPAFIGIPSGTVSLHSGAILLGTANVNSSGIATYTTSSLSPGSHSITAVYSGNGDFATSTSSPLIETIKGFTLTATRTTLTASLNSVAAGELVTFTATVKPAPTMAPTGTVKFYAGTVLLRTVAVTDAGVAPFTTASLAPGSHSITAVYSGNADFATSTSAPLIETIKEFTLTATRTTLTASLNSVAAGELVTFTATVKPAPTMAPIGAVSFYAGTVLLRTCSRNQPSCHQPPCLTCTCGVYAAKNFQHLRNIGYAESGIHGETYLWGTVVEHTLGYRAQFAYPKSIVLPHRAIPFKLTEAESRLQTLMSYGVDLLIRKVEGTISLWSKESGFNEAAFDYLIGVHKKYYEDCLRERVLSKVTESLYSVKE